MPWDAGQIVKNRTVPPKAGRLDHPTLHQEPLKQEYHFSLLFEEPTPTCSYSSFDGGCPG